MEREKEIEEIKKNEYKTKQTSTKKKRNCTLKKMKGKNKQSREISFGISRFASYVLLQKSKPEFYPLNLKQEKKESQWDEKHRFALSFRKLTLNKGQQKEGKR